VAQNPRDGTMEPKDALSEETEDYFDSMSPINDMLKIAKSWWILEFIPIRLRTQDKKTGEWKKYVGTNLGRYRTVRDERPKLHYSVLLREAEHGYQMKNEVDMDAEWQIVI